MAKHSAIYPSCQELEAVQTLVSTVECALKQVSDWLDQSSREVSGQPAPGTEEEDVEEEGGGGGGGGGGSEELVEEAEDSSDGCRCSQ